MIEYRRNGLKLLKTLILPHDAIALEYAIYDYICQDTDLKDTRDYFPMLYNTKLSDLAYNLNQRNSPKLLLDIVNGEIDIKRLPFLSPEELNIIMWMPIIKKREYVNHKRNNRETTKAYKCYKCGERKCTVVEMLARSADEPMTQFITCQNCNYRFRIG